MREKLPGTEKRSDFISFVKFYTEILPSMSCTERFWGPSVLLFWVPHELFNSSCSASILKMLMATVLWSIYNWLLWHCVCKQSAVYSSVVLQSPSSLRTYNLYAYCLAFGDTYKCTASKFSLLLSWCISESVDCEIFYSHRVNCCLFVGAWLKKMCWNLYITINTYNSKM